MELNPSDIGERAFGETSVLPTTVKYESQQHALDFMWSVLGDGRAIGFIEGPVGSGKTSVLRQLIEELPRETVKAVVNGNRIKPRALVSEVLEQYGYTTDLQSTDELLQLLEMFVAQQTRTYQAPILIVDNADRMFPSALKVLHKMAAMREQNEAAMRILLAGRRRVKAPSIQDDEDSYPRMLDVHQLGPMSKNETLVYLHGRIEAAGVGTPDSIFPGDTCDRLHKMSKGWPGPMNAMALSAIEESGGDTVTVAKLTGKPRSASSRHPTVIISRNGRTLDEYAFDDRKVLIGRSDFADIVIDDEFSSKFHVLLMLYSDGLVLLDLNSVNGTTVNSVRVKSALLLEDDVVSIGHHRLKVVNVPVPDSETARQATIADTRRMKNLEELRRKRESQLKVVPS